MGSWRGLGLTVDAMDTFWRNANALWLTAGTLE